MEEEQVKGKGHEIKGAIKEGVGKLTGDTQTEAEGKGEKVAGKAQGTLGKAKDTIKDALGK